MNKYDKKQCPKCGCVGFKVTYWRDLLTGGAHPASLKLDCRVCEYFEFKDTEDCKLEDRLWGHD